MEECPVCKHGMLMIERTILGILVFQCPFCLYLESMDPKKPKKSKVQIEALRKASFDQGYINKTTTNRLIVAVSKKVGR